MTALSEMSGVTTEGPFGYSLPLSPSGTSSMLTPPPWHFSGEVVMVEYRVDPGKASDFLPPGLDLGADPGAAAAVFAEWQWCSDGGAELSDPARCQFAEFLLLVGCQFGDRLMARCPYAWVDQAVPLVRGWLQGMPKQYGEVHQTRAVGVGQAGPRRQQGGRFGGTLSVHGRRVAEATVTLTEPVEEPPALHAVPLVHSLAFPGWAGPARPAELATAEVTDVAFADIWTGAADLRLFDALDPDFAGLCPVEVGAGYVFSYGETLHGGRWLGHYRP